MTDPTAGLPDTRAPAVAAARRGWWVFPCRLGDKRPAVRDWERRACADPERVARCWPAGANVGIACGPSRLVVIDLDCHQELPEDWRQIPGLRDGRDVFAQLCEWAAQPWPSTHMVKTPSGGWHLYFTAPDHVEVRNTAGAIGPGIDTRGRGGYVVGSGSAAQLRYECFDDMDPVPLPGWLTRLLTRPEARSDPIRDATPANPGRRLAGILRAVAEAPEGERNMTLYWAACRCAELAARGADRAELAAQLEAVGAAAGLPVGEARRTIASGMGGGQ
jgi:hypothetical protein